MKNFDLFKELAESRNIMNSFGITINHCNRHAERERLAKSRDLELNGFIVFNKVCLNKKTIKHCNEYIARERVSMAKELEQDGLILLSKCFTDGVQSEIAGQFTYKGVEEINKNNIQSKI